MRETPPHLSYDMLCFLHRRRSTDVSDTRKLTPALSTAGRDLLRQEIYKLYKGLADRSAGRVKDLDAGAILAKGKELFQRRSISNPRQFGIEDRKTLLLLLLLFAIP